MHVHTLFVQLNVPSLLSFVGGLVGTAGLAKGHNF